MAEERTIKSINKHDVMPTDGRELNVLVQPATGEGSGQGAYEGEQYRMNLTEKLGGYVEFTDIVNSTAQTEPGTALDGRQGKVLKDLLDDVIASKAAANGIATLDAGGKIPNEQLPPLAIVDVFPDVQNEAAMLALVAQKGDIAVRTDTSQVFILADEPASTLANWVELSVLTSVIDEHKEAQMPHIIEDLSTGKRYRYGYRISADGFPQKIYEEVL